MSKSHYKTTRNMKDLDSMTPYLKDRNFSIGKTKDAEVVEIQDKEYKSRLLNLINDIKEDINSGPKK